MYLLDALLYAFVLYSKKLITFFYSNMTRVNLNILCFISRSNLSSLLLLTSLSLLLCNNHKRVSSRTHSLEISMSNVLHILINFRMEIVYLLVHLVLTIGKVCNFYSKKNSNKIYIEHSKQ